MPVSLSVISAYLDASVGAEVASGNACLEGEEVVLGVVGILSGVYLHAVG